jgi:hypothetical protein
MPNVLRGFAADFAVADSCINRVADLFDVQAGDGLHRLLGFALLG